MAEQCGVEGAVARVDPDVQWTRDGHTALITQEMIDIAVSGESALIEVPGLDHQHEMYLTRLPALELMESGSTTLLTDEVYTGGGDPDAMLEGVNKHEVRLVLCQT